MDARTWDERYAATDQAWSSEPNAFVVSLTEGLVPGTAIDLGTGEGRNARWLAQQGWHVDRRGLLGGRDRPSTICARRRADRLAGCRPQHVRARPASTTWCCSPTCTYRRRSPGRCCVGPRHGSRRTGRLVVVSHAVRNATEGVGGPPDPAVLHDEALLRDIATGLTIEHSTRSSVDTAQGTAIDVVLRARRDG